MGWIQHKDKVDHEEDEERAFAYPQQQNHPHLPVSMPEHELPFIAAAEISSKSRPGRLAVKGQTAQDPSRLDWWIVIDNVVFDVTDFILDHPGGEQVIMSFIGEDCTWQFRRFHSTRIMQEQALPLRIGRTEGVKNRFKEPKKIKSRLASGDEW